jgi:dihydrofolate synthase/folylpolyglutamate synthase
MVGEVLKQHGQRVHRFCSPPLDSWQRVIRPGDLPLTTDHADDLNTEILPKALACGASPFEFITALAILAFARDRADVALIECGMGGRDDATNVLATTVVAAVTALGHDHAAHLGGTLHQIAAHKVGIARAGVPLVVAPDQPDEIIALIPRLAGPDVPLVLGGRDFSGTAHRDRWLFQWQGRPKVTLPLPGLRGPHQIHNATTALAICCQLIGWDATVAAAPDALSAVRWPGRLEPLSVPPFQHAVVDGAHNAEAVTALVQVIDGWRRDEPQPLALILGALGDRDPTLFAPLVARCSGWVPITVTGGRVPGLPAEVLARALASIRPPLGPVAPIIPDAVAALAPLGGRLLITGSLSLWAMIAAATP